MAPLYDFLTTAGSALAIPALYLRASGDPDGRRGLRERLGHLPAWPGPRGIWIQAVSVGEVRQARTFLEGLRQRMGREAPPVALSSTTNAGRRVARDLETDLAFAFPLDVPWIVRRALDRLAPAAYGTVETELWPGLLSACGAREIPAFIVNGSVSRRSARRWRWLSRAIREGLGALRAACMQTQEDARRLLELGAPEAAVEVTGNLKFDGGPPDTRATAALRASLGLPEGAPVLVAGSTAPGEEATVVEAWLQARQAVPELHLLVAPRHPDRFDEAAREMEAAGAAVRRRSGPAAGGRLQAGSAVLLDTLGELEAAYGLGRVAFVGGSLAPRGGQNPLEPARLGVPVLFGPGMDNFREIADGLEGCGAARVVRDGGDLAGAVTALLTDDEAWRKASAAGPEFLAAHAGATGRTLSALARRIPGVFG